MPYGPREAADAIRHAGAKAVFAVAAAGERRPSAELVKLRPDLPSLAHVVAVGGEAPDGALAFDDVARPGVALPPPPAARDPYVMLFTSGTSSSPKAVLTDYRRFLANARLNCSEKQMGPGSIMLSAAPFSPSVRAFLLPSHALRGRHDGPAAGVQPTRSGRGDPELPAESHLRRARPYRLVPGGGSAGRRNARSGPLLRRLGRQGRAPRSTGRPRRSSRTAASRSSGA